MDTVLNQLDYFPLFSFYFLEFHFSFVALIDFRLVDTLAATFFEHALRIDHFSPATGDFHFLKDLNLSHVSLSLYLFRQCKDVSEIYIKALWAIDQ